MALDPVHAFYCSRDYLSLAQSAKSRSGGLCARCGGAFDVGELRPHHKIPVTPANLCDVSITLDPANVEVLCADCHNAVHKRFGHAAGEKRVYLIHGSPCAGKTTYVQTVATREDLVVDLDRLHAAVTVAALYDKPDATRRVAFGLRDYLLEEIRTAGARRPWQNAYIIGTYPERLDRERFVRDYRAELIHIDTPREECIRRATEDETRRGVREAVVGWIEQYWQRYRP